MNKQRKVLITITYNEMGIIIDTKAEEVAQPNLQPTCSQLATDTISRQAAIDEITEYGSGDTIYMSVAELKRRIEHLPPAQPDLCDGCDRYGTSCVGEGCGKLEMPEVANDTNVPNNDCISRQMAIDALDVLCQEHRYRIPGKRETYSEYNEAWQDALDRAEGAIGNLPSAQPEETCDTCIHSLFRDSRCEECRVGRMSYPSYYGRRTDG